MDKVIIIGAGPAGLTAAYEILQRSSDMDVLILEQDSQIGGISKTINMGNNRFDLGGHRYFTKSKEVLNCWKSLLVFSEYEESNQKVMLTKKRSSKIFYQGKYYAYPIKMSIKELNQFGLIEGCKVITGYFKAHCCPSAETSLEEVYKNKFGTHLYNLFFKGYTEKVWGKNADEISSDWGRQRVKGISLAELACNIFRKNNREESLTDYFFYPSTGSSLLWETAAKKINALGGKIITDAKVVELHQDINKIIAVKYVKDGKEFIVSADYIISSMPLADLIQATANVPPEITKICRGLPYRDMIIMGVLLDRKTLPINSSLYHNGKLNKNQWIYVQDDSLKVGRIQVINNWSQLMLEKPNDTVLLTLEYFCKPDDAIASMDGDALLDLAKNELQTLSFIDNTSIILDYCTSYVSKAYPAYWGTYNRLEELINYLNGFENLFCIGRNGQHRYNNMDHSMLTGMKAVECLLGNMNSKNAIWEINSRQAYNG